jgi:hypothetical protein
MALSQDYPVPLLPSGNIHVLIPRDPPSTRPNRVGGISSQQGSLEESAVTTSEPIFKGKRPPSPIAAFASGYHQRKRIKKVLTMENIEIDTFWDFQVGVPGPVPSPPTSRRYLSPSEMPKHFDEVKLHMREVCLRLAVDAKAIDFVERWNKQPGAQRELVLQVIAPWDYQQQNGTSITAAWGQACMEGYQFLLDKNLGHVKVHMIDLNRVKRMFQFPSIDPGTAIVRQWETLRLLIHQAICQYSWHTLSVSSDHSDSEKAVITLSVWEPRDMIWREQREHIQRLCASNGIAAEVVIMPAYGIFFTAQARPITDFSRMQLGASLELKEDKSVGVGTAGGHFLLSGDGAEHRAVGMTCYHVIRAPQLINAGGFSNCEAHSPMQSLF